jgi:signal transduction histidine kinase
MERKEKKPETITEGTARTITWSFARRSEKPFQLVKYFFITSFLVIFIFAAALTYTISEQSKTVLLKKTEEYARLVAENLNHQVFLQFVVPTTIRFGRVELRKKEQFKFLDLIVKNTIYGFHIEKVNIYDLINVLAYSTEQAMVGKKGLGGSDFEKAKTGKTTSRLISQKGEAFWEPAGTRKLITTIPFRVESPLVEKKGPILGVFEIHQDLTREYEEIRREQLLVVGLSAGIMALLFVMLLLIVKRGETLMHKRVQEQKKLEEKLHHSEKLASLGEMVSAVSHEIKNPLGIIMSTAEMLQKKTEGQNALGRLSSIIQDESQRLNGIVNEFLNFAKPQVPRLEPLEIREVMEKIADHLTLSAEKQNVIIYKHFDSPKERVLLDSQLFYQAVLNVMMNALQAMNEGGTLKVGTRYQQKGVWVVIEDSGEGMDPEQMNRIFDPFFTTKDQGSGLGLSIVKNIMESHRGNIQVDSEKGKGTRVSLYFPGGG